MKGEPGKAIDKLIAEGWDVQVTHARPVSPGSRSFYTRENLRQLNVLRLERNLPRVPGRVTASAPLSFFPRGGETRVMIRDAAGDCVARGLASCAIDDLETGKHGDNFNRKLGLRIALGRALMDLKVATDPRAAGPIMKPRNLMTFSQNWAELAAAIERTRDIQVGPPGVRGAGAVRPITPGPFC